MSVYAYFYNEECLYIGSTFDINRRKSTHKSSLKNKGERDLPFYKYLRQKNLTFDDLTIEIVETAINEEASLLLLEKMLIEYLKPNCNIRMPGVPGRTSQEYYESRKDIYTKWRDDNKEKLKLYFQERNKKRGKIIVNKYQREYRANKKLLPLLYDI